MDERGADKRPVSERERQRLVKEHWSWIGMIIEHTAYGIIVGALLVLLLMQFDVSGIGTMIANSEQGLGVTALLMISFGLTFGMVGAGIAIWLRAKVGDDE